MTKKKETNVGLEKALTELKKLKLFNSSYNEAIKMTRFHLAQCEEKTGEIRIEDVDYCLALATRMAVHASK